MADISVIIPCYNAASYIDRLMTTITSQTIGIDSLEIICVDDASTDDTWKHLQVWEQRYPNNIILIHCDENGRQGTARNIGLSYASTDWISFIDSDDWVELDYFETMYQITTYSEHDVIVCQYARDSSCSISFFENRKTDKESRSMLIDTIEKRKLFVYFQSMGGIAPCKLIRKSILLDHQIFFPENLTYEDNYWAALLHFYVNRIYFVEEKMYHYYINTTSTVLQSNAGHHVDCLTVNCIKWSEWMRRGLLDTYREELEFDFIYTCYLGFLQIILSRFTVPPYSLYLLLKEITLKRVPDYQKNKYIHEGLTKFHLTLLESLSLPLNKTQFSQLALFAKAYWTNHPMYKNEQIGDPKA